MFSVWPVCNIYTTKESDSTWQVHQCGRCWSGPFQQLHFPQTLSSPGSPKPHGCTFPPGQRAPRWHHQPSCLRTKITLRYLEKRNKYVLKFVLHTYSTSLKIGHMFSFKGNGRFCLYIFDSYIWGWQQSRGRTHERLSVQQSHTEHRPPPLSWAASQVWEQKGKDYK